jgi:hypothetical protein
VILTLVISHRAYLKVLFSQKSEFPLQDNSKVIEQYSKLEQNLHAQIVKDENEIPKVDLEKRYQTSLLISGLCSSTDLNPKKGLVQDAFSLIQQENVVSYLVD